MSNVIEWLNSNAAAVQAVSAFLAMIGTIAIAYFSLGTWKLFKLEHRRTLSSASEAHHLVDTTLLRMHLTTVYPHSFDGSSRRSEIVRNAETFVSAAPRILDTVRDVNPELVAVVERAKRTAELLTFGSENAPDMPEVNRRQDDLEEHLWRLHEGLQIYLHGRRTGRSVTGDARERYSEEREQVRAKMSEAIAILLDKLKVSETDTSSAATSPPGRANDTEE